VRQRTTPLETLVVFGCGEQAYWHVRLTLLARGEAVRKVVFVNRRVSEASREVLRRFVGSGSDEVKEREGWKKGCVFEVLTREEEGYEGKVRELLREADVVFCCTPSTEPLFDGHVWASEEAKRKGRLVVAIGSYTPDMREVPGELIRESARRGEKEAGVLVVDTIDGAKKEAGELHEARGKHGQLVE
jgi:ornithine cyclodeaminase/alanine dehydrogenase-like protein (mu-crystallin family)